MESLLQSDEVRDGLMEKFLSVGDDQTYSGEIRSDISQDHTIEADRNHETYGSSQVSSNEGVSAEGFHQSNGSSQHSSTKRSNKEVSGNMILIIYYVILIIYYVILRVILFEDCSLLLF